MYDGTHALIFGPTDGSAGKNTWTDWFLIPTSRPTMSPPGAQNRFVEIPGMNGSYDLSNYLTDDITYTDRSGSFEFIVDRDKTDWLTAYRTISVYLHGQRLRVTLTDDPEWYYEGRFTLDEFKSEPQYSKIVISYRVSPFKISVYSSFVQDILWDPFNFDLDDDWSAFWHIQSTAAATTYNVESYGLRFKLDVRLVSGGPVTASFGGVTKTLTTAGVIEQLGDSKQTGTTVLTLTGDGVVDVGWRKVSL